MIALAARSGQRDCQGLAKTLVEAGRRHVARWRDRTIVDEGWIPFEDSWAGRPHEKVVPDEVEAKTATVATLRDGRLVRWTMYQDMTEALEAVGLATVDAPACSFAPPHPGTLLRPILFRQAYPGCVPVLEATITCPFCGTQARESMPENACRHFYRCTGCGQMLEPKPGDCCVFCSYADTVCPPKQAP